MKNQTTKKLFVFMLLVSVMFSLTVAKAQIIYTDVIPDSTMYCNAPTLPCNKTYNLDLNNDANNDFILKSHAWNFMVGGIPYDNGVSVSPLNGNAVKDTLVSSDTVSIPLQLNAVIDNNLLSQQSWQTSGLNSMKNTAWNGSGHGMGHSSHGLWDNLSDYYLGLRLLQSGQTYYGWIRLRVDVTTGYASIIIRDYAYNSIPNQPILAGQTIATGIIENSFASSINLFPNPANNHLTIDLGNNYKKAEVTITDITGKIIYTTLSRNTQNVEVNTQEFATGIYVVQIQSEDLIETKKLILKK